VPIQQHARLQHGWLESEWTVFLSDDDYLEPTFVEELTASLERHPSAALLYSRARVHMWDVEYDGMTGPSLENGWEFLLAFLEGRREPCWCAMALRTADLRDIGPLPDRLHIGDMYYWVRIADRGDVACVSRPLAHYLQIREVVDNATSRATLREWLAESEDLADRMCETIRRRGGDQAPGAGRLARMRRTFLATTAANQIIWNVMGGRPRLDVWKDVAWAGRCFLGAPHLWPRVLGASFAPRRLLRSSVRAWVAATFRNRSSRSRL
jgi:hypothetical protein